MELRNPGCNVGGEEKIIDNQTEKKIENDALKIIA